MLMMMMMMAATNVLHCPTMRGGAAMCVYVGLGADERTWAWDGV